MPSLILYLTHDHVGVRLDVCNLAWFLLYQYQAPKLPPVEAEPECQQTVERVGAGGGNEKKLGCCCWPPLMTDLFACESLSRFLVPFTYM